MKKNSIVALSSLAIFVLGFPFLVNSGGLGGLFGVLICIPLAMVAWAWGERVGLLTALGGIIYLDAVLMVHDQIIQGRALPQAWSEAILLDLLVICLVALVARLHRALKGKTAIETSCRSLADRSLAVLKALHQHVFELDRHGRIHQFRPSQKDVLAEPLGPSPLGRTVVELLPVEVAAAFMKAIAEAARTGASEGETFFVTQAGKSGWYELSVAAIGDARDPDPRFIVLGRDITERRTLEQQLIQSQKMEAVGRLAGGVAHDFNNILQAIMSFSELILVKNGGWQEIGKDVAAIKDSAQRAASLTQRLLAFSRKQMVAPKVIDTDTLIEESLQMLRRIIGQNVTITHEADTAANHVKVDPAQFAQVITNLAINARDAMPQGGILAIKVRRVEIVEKYQQAPEMLPGAYVSIEVGDTGTGMDQETLSHLFEPFFTTKVAGRGTGLGLSIVHGVVKQAGGYIDVKSTLRQGTTFTIYLPRVEGSGVSLTSCPEEEHGGAETILVVEDEEAIRLPIVQSLTACGYKVLEARSGVEAEEICARLASRIQLLLADVGLPVTGGGSVARQFRTANPLGRVVFMTDDSHPKEFGETTGMEGATILQKPFSLSSLAQKVRQALDQPQTNW